MNAHIERMARGAGLREGKHGLWNAEPEEIEAFAKAIAEDCANLVQVQSQAILPNAVAALIRERYK